MTRFVHESVHRVRTAAVVAAISSCGLLPAPLLAEDDEDVATDQSIEEIVVIGSRLRRRDFSAPSPIATLTREDIEATGQKTLESALSQMPQFIPDFDRTANNPGNGRGQVNLRGLGPHRTLVMLNGRRLGPSGIGTAVDVNNLPQALISGAEIITGGASSVYGSDAVAGIVNFTLREDFDGFGMDISAYSTEKGDSNIYDLSLAWGHNFADGRGNVTLFGGYYDREETYADARAFTSVPWLDNWETGELEQGGSFSVPEGALVFPSVDFGNGNTETIFDADGNPREFSYPEDLYNYAPWNYLQLPMRRYNGGVILNYDLTDRAELYVEATYSESSTRRVLAPVPTVDFFEVNYDNPVLTPITQQFFVDNLIPWTNDTGLGLFRKRLEELGPRISELTSEYTRLLTGLRGGLGADWEFDAWLTYTRNDEHQDKLNGASWSRLQQGLLVDPSTGECFDPSGGCLPVDIFGPGKTSPEAIAFLRQRAMVDVTFRDQFAASGFARGELFRNWAGPVEAVIGGEWRKDEGRYVADELLLSDDTLGWGADPSVDGEEQVYELFGELLVPLAGDVSFADYLALELGYRYSRYRHAKAVETFKAGLEWRPVVDMGFRVMLQRAARAPNLSEAFQEQTSFDDFLVTDDPTADPCTASGDPIGDGNLEKCVLTGLPADQVGVFEAFQFPTRFISGGNPDLGPEQADTLTAGIVITPESLPGLQLSVDYYDIEIEGEIGQLAAIEACFDPANTAGLFCDLISRDSITHNVDEIREFNVNRGVARTSGIDTQLAYRRDLPAALALGDAGAEFSANVIWTHVRELSGQNTPFSTALDCRGTFGWPCMFRIEGMTWPTDRVTTRLGYGSGPFTSNLTWRWVAQTDNGVGIGAPLIGLQPDEINPAVLAAAQKHYFDLSFSYLFGENVMAMLTIANLTDTDPPMMADWVWDKNTDTRMYDVFGRSYTLSFSLSY